MQLVKEDNHIEDQPVDYTLDNIKKVVATVVDKIKAKVDEFPVSPSFDFHYWKGHCNALEEVKGFNRDDVWVLVKPLALEYCDSLRK
jgi:hypothetical protein